jgi:hypothetical protein
MEQTEISREDAKGAENLISKHEIRDSKQFQMKEKANVRNGIVRIPFGFLGYRFIG